MRSLSKLASILNMLSDISYEYCISDISVPFNFLAVRAIHMYGQTAKKLNGTLMSVRLFDCT